MLLRFYEKDNSAVGLRQIVDILNNDEIIIYSTDTVHAIGYHGLKEYAVEYICQLKAIGPKENNLPIICYDLSSTNEHVKFDNSTFRLAKRNLPGPFTFTLSSTTHLPKIFCDRKEVGIHMLGNLITQEPACFLDAPTMTTTFPYEENEDIEYCIDPELIDEKFGNIVDLIIDGGIGGIENPTIVDCTNGEAEIVRQGEDWLGEGQ